MKLAVLRFRLALVLFLVWIGWLAFLTFSTARPIVLSRPQFLVANLVVIADVKQLEAAGEVLVKEVYWPKEAAKDFEGKPLKIANLIESQGEWNGPGLYILPLMSDLKSQHRVAPIPPSPGFATNINGTGLKPRIYALTSRTRQQLEEIRQPEQLPLSELPKP